MLQDILDWANRIDREGLPKVDERLPRERADRSAPASRPPALRPAAISRRRRWAGEGDGARTATMIRVPAALVDELLRLVGETIILTGQVRERVERAETQTRAMQGQFSLLRSSERSSSSSST